MPLVQPGCPLRVYHFCHMDFSYKNELAYPLVPAKGDAFILRAVKVKQTLAAAHVL